MDILTHSQIFEDAKDISISKEVISAISSISPSNKILSIYSTNARAIYFFPINSDVYKIKIHIFPLTPEIVAKIMNKISEVATKVIYSTGLCLVENRCFWEGFLQENDLTSDIEEIKDTLSSIAEIKDIEVDKVSSS
ncbi:MAG: hypothetical protein ACTSX6_07090 [Candidatus Heimdallarchaeaceae archaeon]